MSNLKQYEADIINLRRHFHKNPETANAEFETANFIKNFLCQCGLDVVSSIAQTGVIGVVKGALGDGPVIGIRSDMDALPINEENPVSYRSTKANQMHACGHDGHMAVTLMLAKILMTVRRQMRGKVVFIFQPAEENLPEGGAKRILAEGGRFFEDMNAIFGFHFWPFLETGKIAVTAEPMMAAGDIFEVRFIGRGAHGGTPHESTDVLLMACNAALSLTSIITRNIEPGTSATLSIGAIEGGKSPNVLPNNVLIRGTTRYIFKELGDIIPQKIENVLEGICRAYNGSYELAYRYGYPILKNDAAMAEAIAKSAVRVVGESGLVRIAKPSLTSEDFAVYLQKVPGCYFWVGAQCHREGVINALHNPRFDLDEAALLVALKVLWTALHQFGLIAEVEDIVQLQKKTVS